MNIDTLVLCSKILYNERILEQHQEIEKLELKLFWFKYNYYHFKNAMKIFNDNITKCNCLNCTESGRYNYDEENMDDEEKAQHEQEFQGKETFDCRFQDTYI
jgi:hypothetical protein